MVESVCLVRDKKKPKLPARGTDPIIRRKRRWVKQVEVFDDVPLVTSFTFQVVMIRRRE